MKYKIKLIGLFVVGLLVAVIIYPSMHEVSHSIIAILVGGKILEFNILPLPNILCNVQDVEDYGMIVIGFSGMIIPYLLSILVKSRNFWCWYAAFLVKGISLLAFVISAVGVVLYMLGDPIPNEDITKVLDVWQSGEYVCFIILLFFIVITVLGLIKEKPIKRCMDYFVNSTEKVMRIV